MIDFESFKAENGIPIYLQILQFVKRGIAHGTIRDGDELPSRRGLSVLLGINPNTVQRAFSMLEEEGLITSSHGVTSVVSADEAKIEKVREELLTSDVVQMASSLKQSGMTLEQAIALLAHYWEEA